MAKKYRNRADAVKALRKAAGPRSRQVVDHRSLAMRVARMLNRALSLIGLRLVRDQGPLSTSPEFERIYGEIKARSVTHPMKIFMIYQWARRAAHREGDVAEVGVFRGGISRLLARECPGKVVHLFDTFSGMPKENIDEDTESRWEGGFRDTSLKEVMEYLNDLDNVSFHPGIFPKTAADVADRRFCLVHLDVDLYESTKAGLEFFYSRMVPGGVVIVDDYSGRLCPGVTRALSEFLSDKPDDFVMTSTNQALLIKD